MSKTNRRELLTLGLSGALGLAFLPMLRRVARAAAPGPTAKADRVLILNLTGGIRSSAAFHASPQIPYNPYGLMSGVATPFALGAILDDGGDEASYTLGPAWGNARVAKLREIANQMSVLGTYSTSRGDHLRARIEEPTGNPSGGAPGILTRVAAGLVESSPDPDAVQPGFHISPSALFGNGGALTKYVPVSLANFASVPSASNTLPQWVSGTGNDFATDDDMRDRFDQNVIARRAGVGKLTTETLSFHRRAARDIGARLSQNDFAFATPSQDAATFGQVALAGGPTALSNGMLKELFRKGVPPQYNTFAVNLALAVRLLQIGSPCVTLETPNFDFHSGERTAGPPLYGYLGRAWAALHWLLSRIPSGAGTLLDRTLVITMSDFGRDRAQANGWNAGDGSDHGADFACFYLAHAVMGAGVTPNKLVGAIDTNTYNGNGGNHYTPQQVLVTLLDALGLDHENEQWGLPTGGAPIAELWS
jgi:hypothetical protein